MAAAQTGTKRATGGAGAKTGKGKNGEVIVEKVMTSDSFLSREIKKAPLVEHDGSLVADISHIPNDLKITIQGAREHNLKNVDLAIPRNRMVVFTGLSGSGKSSLAFDTLFAEGQRRYVESLSAYARQFLGQMDKPDVDFIEGLSPAVSIDQKTTNRNPRSTVGDSSSPAPASRTAPNAASQSPPRPRSKSSTPCLITRNARDSRFSRPWSRAVKASSWICLNCCAPTVMPARSSTAK